uniref:Uncharacterized protein n=1 Tax=Arundo donax TaxID=35708 RepID=A0A0A9BZ99_ARUDO
MVRPEHGFFSIAHYSFDNNVEQGLGIAWYLDWMSSPRSGSISSIATRYEEHSPLLRSRACQDHHIVEAGRPIPMQPSNCLH